MAPSQVPKASNSAVSNPQSCPHVEAVPIAHPEMKAMTALMAAITAIRVREDMFT